MHTQLELETEGHLGVAGHAAVRFSNPTTGGDALPTIRTEMHRVTKGTATLTTREAASSVWQVFEGTGSVSLNGRRRVILRGDFVAVPSWCEFTISADTELTLSG